MKMMTPMNAPSCVLTQVKGLLKSTFADLGADPAMGYLSVTSKPELPVRDRLAFELHQRLKGRIVAREFTISCATPEPGRKKVDLAILDKRLSPEVLIELKAMISPDPLDKPDHWLMGSLAEDLKRIAAICKTPSIGVMLMVDIGDLVVLVARGLDSRIVKYLGSFKKYASQKGRLERSIRGAESFFKKAKLDTTTVVTKLSPVWGSPVELVSFIVRTYAT